eukprot:346473-Prorocentrum_minimum.AAC.4
MGVVVEWEVLNIFEDLTRMQITVGCLQKKVKKTKKLPAKEVVASEDPEVGQHLAVDPETLGAPSDEPIDKLLYNPSETDMWLYDHLRMNPISTMYPGVALKAQRIVTGWQRRFANTPWIR